MCAKDHPFIQVDARPFLSFQSANRLHLVIFYKSPPSTSCSPFIQSNALVHSNRPLSSYYTSLTPMFCCISPRSPKSTSLHSVSVLNCHSLESSADKPNLTEKINVRQAIQSYSYYSTSTAAMTTMEDPMLSLLRVGFIFCRFFSIATIILIAL